MNLEGVWFLIWLAAALAYYILLEAVSGQTLGKRVMNLRVVSADGTPPSLGQVVGRNLLRPIDAFPVFYLVGFIVAAVDGEGRRLGDMAAGTRVARQLAAWEREEQLMKASVDEGW
ncbi:MAG: RDD family protein [Tepidiformaceae bacterium]